SHLKPDSEPPRANMEAEKRIRREIANSNERRRMQSINNGFQSLRSLLPHHEGEKLSKILGYESLHKQKCFELLGERTSCWSWSFLEMLHQNINGSKYSDRIQLALMEIK
ncbi:HLH domain containing protein, partial [Oryctes borbonicus]